MKNALLLILVLFSTHVFGQLKWESVPSIPEYGRYTSISFSVNGKLYVGLGHIPGGGYSNQLWEYDPATKLWSQKSDYPGNGRRLATAFTIGSKGYVGLGGNGSARFNDFYEYDPNTDNWTQKANFPGGNRYDAASFAIGNYGYIGTGSCGGTTCYTNDFYQYNPSTNTWTQKANFPAGNSTGVTGIALNGIGYFGNSRNTSNTLSNNYYKYTPGTNTWAAIASMPGTLRRTTMAFTLDNKIYVGCGAYNYSNPIFRNDFYRYSGNTNTWSIYTCNTDFTPRLAGITAQISDSVVLAGMGNSSNGYLADLWQLNANSDTCDYQDTTFVTDTTFTTIYDTSYVIVKDTQTVYKLDTIEVYVIDTFYRTIFDTTYITTYDTVSTMIYDTVTIYTYDTITRYVTIAVEDTLNFSIYTDNCFNITHKLYPNPSSEMVYLFSNNADCLTGYRLEFIDALGRILETKPYATLVSFDVRSYARALYFVRLIGKDGDTLFSKKVVIR
jgi:N-acetylneuraminic acid mutarotase